MTNDGSHVDGTVFLLTYNFLKSKDKVWPLISSQKVWSAIGLTGVEKSRRNKTKTLVNHNVHIHSSHVAVFMLLSKANIA